MLKTCWECILGNTQQTDNEVRQVYDKRLNGDSVSAPPWPEAQKEKEIMFILPRILEPGHTITVTGTMTNGRRRFGINLITGNSSPDYRNIACQFEALFPDESSNDQANQNEMSVKIIQNGQEQLMHGDHEENAATDVFTDTSFKFGLSLRIHENMHMVDIYIDDSLITRVYLQHYLSQIRFLSITGDVDKVDKLEFEF